MASPTASDRGPLARFIIISFDRHPNTSARVAQRVNERLKTFGLQNLSIVNVNDLTPELSGQLAGVDYAIFIDSPQVGNRVRVKVRALEAHGNEPAGSSMPGSGHSWDPSTLLALAHSVYGRHPQSWLVQVFMPKAELQSPGDIEDALDQALREVESLIRPGSIQDPE
jgi:hydrogenase maturation protease